MSGISKRVHSSRRNVNIGGGTKKYGLAPIVGTTTLLKNTIITRTWHHYNSNNNSNGDGDFKYPPIMIPRSLACATTYRGKIYLIGGFGGEDDILASVEVYDGINWVAGPSINVPRAIAGVATYNDKIYLIGGLGIDGFLNSVEVFDGISWSEQLDISLNNPRAMGGAAVFQNSIYIVGGIGLELIGVGGQPGVGDISGLMQTNEIFDGTTWTVSTGLVVPRVLSGVTTHNNKLYAVGGAYSHNEDNDVRLPNVEEFDGTNWTQIQDLSFARVTAGAVSYNVALYAIGGSDNSNNTLSSVEIFDGTNWTLAPPLSVTRGAACAVVFNNKIYNISGIGGNNKKPLTHMTVFDGEKWIM